MTKLFRGGTVANTLNGVPDAIDKMLKENYKKIATGKQTIPSVSGNVYKINMNLTFVPKRIFCVIYEEDDMGEMIYDLTLDSNTAGNSKNYQGKHLYGKFETTKLIKNYFELTIGVSGGGYSTVDVEWIAIE